MFEEDGIQVAAGARQRMSEQGKQDRRLAMFGIAANGVALFLLAMIWPWPAPTVDWQQPLERAIAKGDCRAVNAIVLEASTARATEVFEYYARLSESGTCREKDIEDAAAMRRMKQNDDFLVKRLGPPDWRPRDENDVLMSAGWIYDAKLSALNFVCITPYDAFVKPDHARLAQGLRGQGIDANLGFWNDVHIERRAICASLVGGLIRELIDAGTDEANAFAYELLWLHLSRDIRGAGSMFAELVLGHGFVPPYSRRAEGARERAWSWLDSEASDGHLPAIKLMMDYLHAGRFRAVDNKGAYFWSLRLKRLGGEPGDTFEEISMRLTPAERASVEHRERVNSRWIASQP